MRKWGKMNYKWVWRATCVIHDRRDSESAYCNTPWYSSRAIILLTTKTRWAWILGCNSSLLLGFVAVHDGRQCHVSFLEEEGPKLTQWWRLIFFDVKLNRGVRAKRSQKLVHEINYFYFDPFLAEIVPGIWENRSMKENSFFKSFKRSRKATK